MAAPTATPAAAKASAAKVKPAGTLSVGQKELGTFQGHPSVAVNPALFVQQTAPISEGLVTININKEVEGWLAESWSISDDFKTWTFNLKKGVQFHKGYGEMTAEDVIWSYKDGWAGNPLHARSHHRFLLLQDGRPGVYRRYPVDPRLGADGFPERRFPFRL